MNGRAPTKAAVLKRMEAVRKVVEAEICANSAGGSLFARGLSSEGYAGGYLQAIDDIEAALRHGYPSDHRGYWRAAGVKSPPRPVPAPPIPPR